MEAYAVILISFFVANACLLLFFAGGGLVFFFKIFKRKPYNAYGVKKKMSDQRCMVVSLRKEAIAFLKKQPFVPYELKAHDGVILRGKLFSGTSENNKDKSYRNLVICVHGYTAHSYREFAAVTPFLQTLGLDVLLVDDRAHGESDGKYTGFSVLDKDDLTGWLKKFKPDYKSICLYGISMGASTCALAAAQNQGDVDGLIFDCGFTSPWEEFDASVRGKNKHLNAAPIFFFGDMWCRLILGFSFKSVSALEAMTDIKCKTLFIHGGKDKKVPREMSDRLFAACGSENKRQEIFLTAEHTASWYVETERYKNLLIDFFEF